MSSLLVSGTARTWQQGERSLRPAPAAQQDAAVVGSKLYTASLLSLCLVAGLACAATEREEVSRRCFVQQQQRQQQQLLCVLRGASGSHCCGLAKNLQLRVQGRAVLYFDQYGVQQLKSGDNLLLLHCVAAADGISPRTVR